MYIYYKYATDGTKNVVLLHVYECVYLYTSEAIGEWFVDTLRKIPHVKLLVYAHWFMSIIISQTRDHSISVDWARYTTSVVVK